mmetsp:Transcript_5461/g.14250  ORF Transcript_5461/g.14250 Transcript_5461/m.14250 type:complete len:282 (+) Transcript_5461:453-1298(+)
MRWALRGLLRPPSRGPATTLGGLNLHTRWIPKKATAMMSFGSSFFSGKHQRTAGGARLSPKCTWASEAFATARASRRSIPTPTQVCGIGRSHSRLAAAYCRCWPWAAHRCLWAHRSPAARVLGGSLCWASDAPCLCLALLQRLNTNGVGESRNRSRGCCGPARPHRALLRWAVPTTMPGRRRRTVRLRRQRSKPEDLFLHLTISSWQKKGPKKEVCLLWACQNLAHCCGDAHNVGNAARRVGVRRRDGCADRPSGARRGAALSGARAAVCGRRRSRAIRRC